MLIREDTIAALSTPSGRGAIAVVRISGAQAHALARRLLAPWPAEPRRVALCTIRDPRSGEVIDEALVTRFDAPRSYTGEAMCEIACHGGVAVSAAVLDALTQLGARLAEPGEFTQRAVVNGKIDLLRAEGIGDLVDARTQAMRRVAIAQVDGSLSRALTALRDRLLQLEALMAYDIDFPEEDDGPIARGTIAAATGDALAVIDRLLATVPLGEVARDGAVVVIAGPPNAGKSSLFNALLGEGRAIVTDVPGTTRDAVEARVESEGWPLRLVDTAGLRESADVVERLGIEVSERYLRAAHVVLVCGATGEELRDAMARTEALGTAPRIAVRTKSDLGEEGEPAGEGVAAASDGVPGAAGVVAVSAQRRRGLDTLLAHIRDVLARTMGELDTDFPVVTRSRHRVALERARDELDHFRREWELGGLPASIAAVHVRSAVLALDELIGVVEVDDVLDRVFRTFCVGK